MTVKDIFEKQIAAKAKDATDIDAIFFFDITGDEGGQWVVDLTGEGTVEEGTTDNTGKADCNIEMTAEDFKNLVEGKVQGQMLFMTGKLKVSGNMGLALKLGQLIG